MRTSPASADLARGRGGTGGAGSLSEWGGPGVERPSLSPERCTQALTEQGQLREHWANLAGLEGLSALLGPSRAARHLGAAFVQAELPGWLLLCAVAPFALPPLAFQPCGREVRQDCGLLLSKLRSQCFLATESPAVKELFRAAVASVKVLLYRKTKI